MNTEELKAYAKDHPELFGESLGFWEACINGDVNLDAIGDVSVKAYTPSQTARRSFLYPQCITASQFSAGHYTRRKDMQSYLLTQTFFGSGVLEYEQRTYDLQPGDCFFIDCRKEHLYHASSSEGWGYRILHFDGVSMPDYYAQFLQCGSVQFSSMINERLRLLIDRFYLDRPPIQANAEIVYSCMLTGLVTEIILATSSNGHKPMPKLVENILNYIEMNYTRSIVLDDLARAFYVSKFHLCREFKKYTNATPNDYLIETRLNAAKALLQSTDLGIGEICAKVGIASADHFLYLFKSREGIPPSAFRRQWRNISANL